MQVETSGLPVTREQSGWAPLRSASKRSVEMMLSFWDNAARIHDSRHDSCCTSGNLSIMGLSKEAMEVIFQFLSLS